MTVVDPAAPEAPGAETCPDDLVRFVRARTHETAALVESARCSDLGMPDALMMVADALATAEAVGLRPGTLRALALAACLYDDHPHFHHHWRRWSR